MILGSDSMLYKKVRFRGGREGIVLEVKEDFAKILSNGEIFWFPLNELEEDDITKKLVIGEIDDPIDFILAMDAYRLSTEYKFNPYVLASSTRIEIFPHQIDEVMLMLDRPRILLADEVGLGKTIVAALVASELIARGLVKKLLFVVPKALVDKWEEELRSRFEMNVKRLDSRYVKDYGDPFKDDKFCFVASMDTLRQEHFLKLLENADLDFVVVDEAHKLSKNTQRYRLGKVLAKRTKYLYLLTATPHRGDDEDYLLRIKLLDPCVADIDSAKHLVIRNLKDDVVTIDGKEVFPPRESKTVEVPISADEIRIHEMVDNFIARKLEEARAEEDSKKINSARFLGIILKKRASSSFYALKKSLQNRLVKMGYTPESDIEELIRKLREAEEEFDEHEKDRIEQELMYRLILPQETKDIREIIREIDSLGDTDSKFEKLLEMINQIKSVDPKAKIVVFTEYRDTLQYLSGRLSSKFKVTTIDGTMNLEERKQALEKFRQQEGAEIMVCTDAAGEGIDMQFCNVEINYDIPWNPTRLEQRMGRIHRIGQYRKAYYYNFVLRDTLDGHILSKLLEKIEAIREALSERVYDVIGTLIREKDLNDLFEELLRVPKSKWEARLKKIDNLVENRKQILSKIDKLIAGHRLNKAKLEDIKEVGKRAIDEREVKRFVEIFVGHKGGSIEKVGEEIYRIILPRDVAYEIDRGTVIGTFSREKALKTAYPYLALGNRTIMSMLKFAMKSGVSVLRHPYMKGFVFFFRIGVIDGNGQERFGKFVAVTEDGKVVDPKIVWDMEQEENRFIPNANEAVNALKGAENKILELAQSYLQETSRKLKEIKEKTKTTLLSYYSNEIGKWEGKRREYRNKIAESPHYSMLVKSAETKIGKLRYELEKKIKELDKLYQLELYYEPVGVAYVLPMENADAKKAVELAGMEAVKRYEHSRARTEEEHSKINDVSGEFRGYDIESFDRVIEVKSFKSTGKVVLSSNEWIVASRLKDYYWLYVVENALSKPRITLIQDPANTLKEVVRRVPKIEYQYEIDEWKKFAKEYVEEI